MFIKNFLLNETFIVGGTLQVYIFVLWNFNHQLYIAYSDN